MQKLRSIQVVRGDAACAVVVLHAYPEVKLVGGHAVREVGLAAYGAFGVDLFFVISGFIIANLAQTRSAGDFIRDRLWRIYPLWWIALTPWLILMPQDLATTASGTTLWPITSNGFTMPALTVGWTLSFELLFYLAMTMAIATRAWVPLALYALSLVGGFWTSSAVVQIIGSPIIAGIPAGRAHRQASKTSCAWPAGAGRTPVGVAHPRRNR